MLKYKNLNLTVKSLLPIAVSLIIITITLLYYVMPQIKATILEKKKEGLKNVVELAYTTFAGFDKQVKAGKMTLDSAQKQAKQVIKYMRFEGKNYYFVFDYEKMVIQPVSPERENKPLNFFKDDKQNEYLVQAAEICKNDSAGFIYYYKAKPNTQTPLPKISYVRLYKPWGWIIGAGVYFDDIEKDYAAIRNDVLIVFITILVLLMIFSYFNTKYGIIKPIRKIKNAAKEISMGNLNVAMDVNSTDELGSLSSAFDKMKENIKKLVVETEKSSRLASEGKLDYRSNVKEYNGVYRELLEGLNNTMNEIISPLNVTAEYVDRISKGDMPPKIIDDYKGDFNEIKNNLNLCIDSISALIIDIKNMNEEIINGNLNYRINPMKHNGKYREIIDGTNTAIDRLVGLIDRIPLPIQIIGADNNLLYKNKYIKNEIN